MRSTARFVDGKKDGQAQIFDENGRLVLDMLFQMDELRETKTTKEISDTVDKKSIENTSDTKLSDENKSGNLKKN